MSASRVLCDALLPERLLAKLWRAKEGRRLRTSDGRSLRVLYPGRPAPGHGPDFRDAVLELDGEPLRGDVEIHRRPRDWTAHGHGSDAAYDGVVLHVVGTPAPAADGPALSVVLEDEEAGEPAASSFWSLRGRDAEAIRRALRGAGLARFRERSEAALRRIEAAGAEQALYAAVMEALGYAENRAPFLELASRLPASLLRAVSRSQSQGRFAFTLERLLTAASGLGPASAEWQSLVGAEPMDPRAWRTSGVRPPNHPRRRIRGAAALLARLLPAGFVASLSRAAAVGPGSLTDALAVVGDGDPVALVGLDRAREIAAGAVLPALAAWASARRAAALGRACRETYLALPAPQDNTVTREARRLLGLGRVRLTACEQQGLLHLYRRAVHGG